MDQTNRSMNKIHRKMSAANYVNDVHMRHWWKILTSQIYHQY